MKNKKSVIITYSIIGCFIEYGMFLLAGAWEKGNTIYELLPRLQEILAHPMGWYFNRYTPIFLSIGLFITGILLMYELTKPDLMPGREYGTAKWENVKRLTQKMTEGKNMDSIRIYSEGLRISTNSEFTGINNNCLVVGGPGTGKSWFLVQPNLWQENGSFVVTDPKGELLGRNGRRLLQDGYVVRVLNLVDMKSSDCFNPFVYIRESADIRRLITNLIANTTSEEARKHTGDPFWEKSESMFLQSLFIYVWMEEPTPKRNISSLMNLLAKAEYTEDGVPSELDDIMTALEAKKGESHPAVRNYKKVIRGAGDTIRSIIISANARMAPFEEEDVLRIFSRDDFEIGSIGAGINMDGKTKTAVFCVIPDNDKTYNFIVGMFYTLACRELYMLADQVYHGKLPIPVTFWFDEFANVALPEGFLLWLATCRSRNLSCVVIIQNIAQIKALFKDNWENIPGNCDILVYLGGNEQSTHEYISKMLGKQTVYKKNTSESRGQHGSTSRTTDVLGRELMTLDEVGLLDNSKCIIKVRGCRPVLDNKFNPFDKDDFNMLKSLGVYIHTPAPETKHFKLLSKEELAACEQDAKRMPDKIRITSLTIEELCHLAELANQDSQPLGEIKNVPFKRKNEVVHGEQVSYKGSSLTEILTKYVLDDERMEAVQTGIQDGLTEEQIICLLNKEPKERESCRNLFLALNERKTTQPA